MTENGFVDTTVGWTAVAAGVAGLAGLLLIILFFILGQPFGTLNDLAIALAASMSGVLAWMLYPAHRTVSPLLGSLGLAAALAGALIVIVGSALVISGVKGWFLAGLYMTAGNALIGLWVAGLAYSALRSGATPHGLAVLGLAAGGIMVVGLASVPGILRGVDSMASAPWYISAGYVGTLGWLLLWPAWCIWLGRVLLER